MYYYFLSKMAKKGRITVIFLSIEVLMCLCYNYIYMTVTTVGPGMVWQFLPPLIFFRCNHQWSCSLDHFLFQDTLDCFLLPDLWLRLSLSLETPLKRFFDLVTFTFDLDLWTWPRYPSTWPTRRISGLYVCPFIQESGNTHTHTHSRCQNYYTRRWRWV